NPAGPGEERRGNSRPGHEFPPAVASCARVVITSPRRIHDKCHRRIPSLEPPSLQTYTSPLASFSSSADAHVSAHSRKHLAHIAL
ncbi:hypothetical protein CORC01_10403, partial [Colletotrichum orchidophilum]